MKREILEDLTKNINKICERVSEIERETCLYQLTGCPVYKNTNYTIEEFFDDYLDSYDYINTVYLNINNKSKEFFLKDLNDKIQKEQHIMDKCSDYRYDAQKTIKYYNELKNRIYLMDKVLTLEALDNDLFVLLNNSDKNTGNHFKLYYSENGLEILDSLVSFGFNNENEVLINENYVKFFINGILLTEKETFNLLEKIKNK